jgi:phosphatidylethanolamine-binding protein (PEBP) family uncharacterized protein
MKLLHIISAGTAIYFATYSTALAFNVSFNWGSIPRCTSGNPNTVGSPAFKLNGVPKGTTKLSFRLRDNNVPSYNHGGGSVPYAGGPSISAGAFKYKSPCPPDGSHTYTWSVTAVDKSGKTLGTASASRKYP